MYFKHSQIAISFLSIIRINYFLLGVNAFPIYINITAPINATNKLYKLNPVIPEKPKKFITNPPIKAPIIPNTMSNNNPAELCVTAEASAPAIRPKINHKIIPILIL